MALVTIVIRDGDDGRVDISVDSEPAFDLADDGALSAAQAVAMNFLNSTLDDAETVHSVKAA